MFMGDLNLVIVDTSRKHCKKEPQLFSHCGSFVHLDLQSLKESVFIIFYATVILKFLGACDTVLEKGILKTVPEIY
jgi:hypothetical protein